jgi:CRP/FNR family transcriptional regulator, cyclic AMP receptor protein
MALINSFHIFELKDDYQDVPAGSTIFEEGQHGDVMYVVKEGDVEILVGGKPVNLVCKGDILGEMALINTKVRSATAIAKTDCKLVAIDEQQFKYLVQEHPFFALDVMSVLANRLRRRLET